MPLVEYDEQRTYLDLDDHVDEVLIGQMLDAVTLLFEKQCGRERLPFRKAQVNRIERQPARPGSIELLVDYPIAALTAISLGVDLGSPTETLNVAPSAGVVTFEPGTRVLTRIDGGVWSAGSDLLSFSRGGPWPPSGVQGFRTRPVAQGWVQVTYDTAPDLPSDAALAVKVVTAALYRQRDMEGHSSYSTGDESHTLEEALKHSVWKAAVAANRRMTLRAG